MTTYLRLAFQNLMRHRTRSALTMLGIAASVGVLFAVFSFNRGFEHSLAQQLDNTGLHFMVVPSGCAHEVAALVLHGTVTPQFLETDVMKQVIETPGVELATPILVAQLANPHHQRMDLMYGIDMSVVERIKPDWEVTGSIPTADHEILLGYEVAAHGDIQVGDTLNYPSYPEPLKVTGIIGNTSSPDDAFIYVPIATAQYIQDRPNGATAIGVQVTNPEELRHVTNALSDEVPGIQIVTMGQVMNSISNLAASAKSLSISIALIAVLISAVGVMNSILMAVFERTQEIGMMRAVGASRLDVFQMVLKETTILSLIGGVVGIVLAVVGSRGIESFVRNIMPYVPQGELVQFEASVALGSVGFILVVGLLAGLYPAWKASTINPIEAIKG
ncbi:ABC transporter permease [Desulfurispira natronophila]|uniref:Putative ABC transport system permease protein n=1 Tax=Desulfurispira natronophila TaxID=682562 RepID=A0A7W8DGS1_9BACT|nr:FtsX-like permease family protein [Desulfurispira natronophila]MBB5021558.1 putative ABC transport system permease protein [Desulfurispira natronophila]